jgi:hypothetical protein
MVVTTAADYTLLVGELRTGKIHARLPFADLKWGIRLNTHGPISATIRPYSKQLERHDLRNLTLPVKQFMAVDYRGTLLEAGPIWTRDYDEDTGNLKLDGLGMWSVFDRRKTLPGGALHWASGGVANWPGVGIAPSVATLDIVKGHLGSIARELVRVSLEDNPHTAGGLPVALPADIPGTAHERHYKGYSLGWIGDDLRELTKVQGGPDLRFRPRYVSGDATRIEWALEHGKVDLLQQDGPDWAWDARVVRSGVSTLGVSQDGTKQANLAWMTGSGQEQEMRFTTSWDLGLVAAGFPWLEAEGNINDEESIPVLQAGSDRLIKDVARPWETWRPVVRADSRPLLGQYTPGDWAVINTPERHPILPPMGKVRVRILAMDGDATNNVKLSVAPIQGNV